MQQAAKQLVQQLPQRWEILSFNQKIMLGTLVGATIMASMFLFKQANDDYDVLYSNMNLTDAAATAAKLKEMKAPYRLADGGTTILVPRGQKNSLVLDTAQELTSQQTVNLAKIPPVVQGDVQKEWIKKLNTDAIAQVLQSIQGIKTAHVLVSQPEHSVFIDEEQPPTASVMLIVEPGFRLRPEQIKTIKNLVAHGVPGLTPEHVAIADNTGNALDPSAGAMGDGTSDADARRKVFERETAKKIAGILGPVVGRENVVVSVSASVNYDQTEAKVHRVLPAGGTQENPTGLAVSNQEQIEEYSGKAKQAVGGPAGTESNNANGPSSNSSTGTAPSYQSTSSGEQGKGDYRLTKRTTNYTFSEEDKKTLYASGNVERMTVAVVLNKVLTSAETEEIRNLVANAAGLDLARGDSVEIKGFKFSQPPADNESALVQASKAAQDQAFILQLASIGAMVVLGAAALFIFYSLFKRPAEGELVDSMVPDYALPSGAMAEAALENAPVAMIEAKIDPELEYMRDAISNMVEDDSGEAARVIMSYLKD
jgi:flagellar M-ring protein FliF